MLSLAELMYESDSHGLIDRLVRDVDTYHQVAPREAKEDPTKRLQMDRDLTLGFIIKYIIAPLTPVYGVSDK